MYLADLPELAHVGNLSESKCVGTVGWISFHFLSRPPHSRSPSFRYGHLESCAGTDLWAAEQEGNCSCRCFTGLCTTIQFAAPHSRGLSSPSNLASAEHLMGLGKLLLVSLLADQGAHAYIGLVKGALIQPTSEGTALPHRKSVLADKSSACSSA